MNKLTIKRQEEILNQAKPNLWGWRYLFRVLLSVQANQQETNKLLHAQVKLLEKLQPHKITDEDVAFITNMAGELNPEEEIV